MSLILRTDVTAVKFLKSYVVAGIGSHINVFHKDSRKILQRLCVLKGQKIYGLVVTHEEDTVIVFGGKQFTVLLKTFKGPAEEFVRQFHPVVSDDWIHSCVWVEINKVALLTAHNVVQIWDTSNQSLLTCYRSKDNSILYSGLLLPLSHDVLVFAGTVYSQVIVHVAGDEKPMHHLVGHKGVIFSISCCPHKEIIVTTSDDRSVRIWSIINATEQPHNTKAYWQYARIECIREVYGHTARVMNNCITNNYIISVGEDSAVCFWDLRGNLVKKKLTHQSAAIWSLDADNNHLVTGGGDSGVIIHPLTVASDFGQIEKVNIEKGVKKVLFTARGNIVALNDNDVIIYYHVKQKLPKMVFKLDHQSTFKLLSLSPCKQLLAVADMCGNLDVFIENCKGEAGLQNFVKTKLEIGGVLSMQWASNRHLVFCSDNGCITVLASKGVAVELYANFTLPPSKERWVVSAALDKVNNVLFVGDRYGNIHAYVKGSREPFRTFNKVHGRYGPTSISIKNNLLITTGRDGTIKYFAVTNKDNLLGIKYMYSKNLEFQWVEKFLDKNENVVCGFHERVFVVYDLKNGNKLLDVPCGGGHRSWDAVRFMQKVADNFEEHIRLVYLKNSDINLSTFRLSNIVSRNVVNGSHCKEINCLQVYKPKLDDRMIFYISGGEDTTVRISSVDDELEFLDRVIFKQLSSIKTIKITEFCDNRIMLISAGGRAQICIKIIDFSVTEDEIKIAPHDLIDYMIKGTDKERKGNKTWKDCFIDFDPETRIMDLDFIKVENEFTVFAGCSDSCLRVFKLRFNNENADFKLIKALNHHKTCILKTTITSFKRDVLATCTTRGDVALWDAIELRDLEESKPFFSFKTNKSGINSFASRNISENELLIATGGDDNCLHLNLLKLNDENDLNSINVIDTWTNDKHHSSQITGLYLWSDLLVSTSIDQRVTLFEWSAKSTIDCRFVSQIYSDVADIQGMEVVCCSRDFVTVCVFGKGMEVIKIPTPDR